MFCGDTGCSGRQQVTTILHIHAYMRRWWHSKYPLVATQFHAADAFIMRRVITELYVYTMRPSSCKQLIDAARPKGLMIPSPPVLSPAAYQGQLCSAVRHSIQTPAWLCIPPMLHSPLAEQTACTTTPAWQQAKLANTHSVRVYWQLRRHCLRQKVQQHTTIQSAAVLQSESAGLDGLFISSSTPSSCTWILLLSLQSSSAYRDDSLQQAQQHQHQRTLDTAFNLHDSNQA